MFCVYSSPARARSQLKIHSIGANLIDTLGIAFSLVNMLIQYSTLLIYYRSINDDKNSAN